MLNCTRLLILIFTSMLSMGASAQTINYQINMTDSFGDGWNGNEIEVKVNGVSQGHFSVNSSPSSAQATFSANDGNLIEVIWKDYGSYDSEPDWTFVNTDAGTMPYWGSGYYSYGFVSYFFTAHYIDVSDADCIAMLNLEDYAYGWYGNSISLFLNGRWHSDYTQFDGNGWNHEIAIPVTDGVRAEFYYNAVGTSTYYSDDIGFKLVDPGGEAVVNIPLNYLPTYAPSQFLGSGKLSCGFPWSMFMPAIIGDQK